MIMPNAKFGSIFALLLIVLAAGLSGATNTPAQPGLWKVYNDVLSRAKYVDLTHTIAPNMPVWKRRHGRIAAGSVVFVRSDWSKRWPDPKLVEETQFPGVALEALQFLHEQRHILFHGHEPLDTDTTPNLEGEAWLMHHGYAQAEGVAHLDMVPEAGALVAIGYPKFKGGTGGYARYIAICPPDWRFGASIGSNDAPLPKSPRLLHWDEKSGARVR